MSQFYDSLKRFVTPVMVSKAARVVGEKEGNISMAISSIFASLLGVMAKDGNNTQQIGNILDEAGNLNLLNNLETLCEENPTEDQRRLGDDFLQNLLGDKAADFSNPIAKYAGISKVATNRLVSMLAPVVVGYFGRKVSADGWSMQKIQHEIKNQKSSFIGLIPDDLARSFGLSKTVTSGNEPVKEEKKNGWIAWVIIILLLLLLLFLWRSCKNRNDITAGSRSMITDTIHQGVISNNMASAASYNDETTRTTATTDTRATKSLTLADGTRMQVFENGTEERMLNYLSSDEYKNATAKDLQGKWFEFDKIAFEFGSATQLETGSQSQLNNIISILKNHKDVKVGIAGFADKRGSEDVNMEISKQRAETIEKMLEDGGVGSQVVKTEGFGDEYAKYSATAPDSERMKDRDIALRFVKD
jgi:Outer membrane protein and related peptidoglycan-associated (lipo)proteins